MDIRDFRARLRNTSGPDNQFTACCPGHDDKTASLSVGVGDDGRILLKCHAGCETAAILEALGLTMDNLFAAPPDRGPGAPEAIYQYRDADGNLLFEVLRKPGKQGFPQRRPDPDKPGRWIYNLKGVPCAQTVLYGHTQGAHISGGIRHHRSRTAC